MKLDLFRPESRAKISLTPLIDVVFILLLFFMLTSSFTEQHNMQLTTPSVAAGPVDDAKIVVISIAAGGIRIGDTAVAPEALRDYVQTQFSGSASVLIKVDAGIPLRDTIYVMDEVKAAGLTAISLVSGEAAS